MTARERLGKYGLRSFALGYLLVLIVAPLILIFYRTFEHGISQALAAITTPEGLHALYLTALSVAIAVPLNAAFGIACAIMLVRHEFRGKALLNALIDLPFAVSPVVIGLSLLLLYSPTFGWLGPDLAAQGIRLVFSVPGIIIACVFVSLPFVVREVVPVLQEIGSDQEQAASTLGASGWQTFRRITVPAIRWGLIYGIVLSTARVLGEFGAVSIVAGNFSGGTQTLPLFVKTQLDHVPQTGAYSASIVLALLALATLVAMNLLRKGDPESS